MKPSWWRSMGSSPDQYIHLRGSAHAKVSRVEPAVPAVLVGWSARTRLRFEASSGRRRAIAEWLTVNARHFSSGLGQQTLAGAFWPRSRTVFRRRLVVWEAPHPSGPLGALGPAGARPQVVTQGHAPRDHVEPGLRMSSAAVTMPWQPTEQQPPSTSRSSSSHG